MTLDARSAMVDGYGYGAHALAHMGFVPLEENSGTACVHTFSSMRSAIAVLISICALSEASVNNHASVECSQSVLYAETSHAITANVDCSSDTNEVISTIEESALCVSVHELNAACSTSIDASKVSCSQAIVADVTTSIGNQIKISVDMVKC